MKKILPSFLIVSLMAGPAFSACKYFRVDAKLRACQAVDKRTIDGKNPYQPEMSDPDLQEANDQKLLQVRCDCEKTEAMKGKSSSVLGGLAGAGATAAGTSRPVKNIVFACDAGMGSSAMGASVLRNKIKKAGLDGITVVNQAIANLDGTADLVITHQDLAARAQAKSPDSIFVSVDNFMNSPKYDEVVTLLQSRATEEATR